MKQWLFAMVCLAITTGLTVALYPRLGTAQGQETGLPNLSDPTIQPTYESKPKPSEFSPTSADEDFPFQLRQEESKILKFLRDTDKEQPNQDILATKDLGEWMVCVASYRGEKAHIMARQLVAEVRGPNYKLPAFVWNYGAEERQKERARLLEMIRVQRNFLRKMKQTGPIKLRLKMVPIDEQAAVLIGGYRNKTTAKKALNEIKKLPMPDPKRVMLDTVFIANAKDGQVKGNSRPVNPFTSAFIVRNPALPKKKKTAPIYDIASLRRLNEHEPYTLLNCKKPVTLAVKEFRMPTVVQDDDQESSILSRVGFFQTTSRTDVAAQSAHSLAEYFRKSKMEAYVLHTKFSSVVTIGAFERPNDPRLKLMQERIQNLNNDPRFSRLQLFPVPQPMKVPH